MKRDEQSSRDEEGRLIFYVSMSAFVGVMLGKIFTTFLLVTTKNITDPATLDSPIFLGLIFLRENLPIKEIHAIDP